MSGSLGLMPSASVGDIGPGVYEPIHGSAPHTAGKGAANSYGTLHSAAMILRQSLHAHALKTMLDAAVHQSITDQVPAHISAVIERVGSADAWIT